MLLICLTLSIQQQLFQWRHVSSSLVGIQDKFQPKSVKNKPLVYTYTDSQKCWNSAKRAKKKILTLKVFAVQL